MIRLAEARDLARLQDIERAAGAPFRDIGMSVIAEDDPPTIDDLADHQSRGRAWVAVDERAGSDTVTAYLLLGLVDDAAHIEQVSVDPAFGRRGIGRWLVEAADDWARQHGLVALTLTTFADVPWNAPYYSRLGFLLMADDELGPQLQALRHHERERGLDAWPRVCMRRPVVNRATP